MTTHTAQRPSVAHMLGECVAHALRLNGTQDEGVRRGLHHLELRKVLEHFPAYAATATDKAVCVFVEVEGGRILSFVADNLAPVQP